MELADNLNIKVFLSILKIKLKFRGPWKKLIYIYVCVCVCVYISIYMYIINGFHHYSKRIRTEYKRLQVGNKFKKVLNSWIKSLKQPYLSML